MTRTKKSVIAAMSKVAEPEVNMTEGLENENEVVNEVVDFTSLEYLKTHNPIFPADCTSAKYNPEREPKITEGMEVVRAVFPNLSELYILMCIWWENKTARNTIKKAIDNEAIEKGIDPVTYMQVDLRSSADMCQALKEAADRMSYAVNYFKPRTATKDVFKQFRIRGVVYNVNLRVLSELKEQYSDPNDRDKFLDEVIKASQEVVIADEL